MAILIYRHSTPWLCQCWRHWMGPSDRPNLLLRRSYRPPESRSEHSRHPQSQTPRLKKSNKQYIRLRTSLIFLDVTVCENIIGCHGLSDCHMKTSWKPLGTFTASSKLNNSATKSIYTILCWGRPWFSGHHDLRGWHMMVTRKSLGTFTTSSKPNTSAKKYIY